MTKMIRSLISIVTLAVALFPLWIFLLANCLLSPAGFWQGLAILGAGIWFLGGIQVVMLGIWIACLFIIWSD